LNIFAAAFVLRALKIQEKIDYGKWQKTNKIKENIEYNTVEQTKTHTKTAEHKKGECQNPKF